MRTSHPARDVLGGLCTVLTALRLTAAAAAPPGRVGRRPRLHDAVMSLAPPQPQVWTGFSAAHHCTFWAAG